MYYEKVFKTLEKFKVKYFVGGGLAVNLYGVPRFTKDIDILVDTSSDNLNRLKKAFRALGYRPRIPVSMEDFLNPENWRKWKHEKGMIALNLYHPKEPYQEIDLLVNAPLSYKDVEKRGVCLRSGSLTVNLISVTDLIKMKKAARRMQDKSDIVALRKSMRLRRQR